MKKTFRTLAVLAAVVCVTVCSKGAAEGVRSALEVCVQTLIPALFPLTVVSTLLADMTAAPPVRQRPGKHFPKAPIRPAELRLLLCAAVGGYPAGVRLTADRFEAETLSVAEKDRLSLCAFFPAPSFAVTAVGRMMFGATGTGLIVYGAVLVSAAVCGLALLLFRRPSPEPVAPRRPGAPTAGPIGAVETSARVMLGICVWTVCFGVVRGCAASLLGKEPALLSAVGEVTAGCLVCAERRDPAAAAAVCAFGGLCVHLQLLPYFKKLGRSYLSFLSFRAVHAALAYLTAKPILRVFPTVSAAAAVGAGQQKAALTSGVGAAMLMLLCVFLVLDTADPEKRRRSSGAAP